MNVCQSIITDTSFSEDIFLYFFLIFKFSFIRRENGRLSGGYLSFVLHSTLRAGRLVCAQAGASILQAQDEAADGLLVGHVSQRVSGGWAASPTYSCPSLFIAPVSAVQSLEVGQIFLLSFLLLRSPAWNLSVGELYKNSLTFNRCYYIFFSSIVKIIHAFDI